MSYRSEPPWEGRDTTDECTVHDGVPLDEQHDCYVCLAEALFRGVDWDAPETFACWAREEAQVLGAERLATLLRERPDRMVRRWQWDLTPERMRLTIRVRVCSGCQRHLGLRELRGADSLRDDPVHVLHDPCDDCCARRERGDG